MTTNEINRLVAEDLGVIACPHWTPFWGGQMMKGDCQHIKCAPSLDFVCYTTSLDAIRAAAMERFKDEPEIFQDALHRVWINHKLRVFKWQLTAADWCEAYLRAAGKWRDGV